MAAHIGERHKFQRLCALGQQLCHIQLTMELRKPVLVFLFQMRCSELVGTLKSSRICTHESLNIFAGALFVTFIICSGSITLDLWMVVMWSFVPSQVFVLLAHRKGFHVHIVFRVACGVECFPLFLNCLNAGFSRLVFDGRSFGALREDMRLQN